MYQVPHLQQGKLPFQPDRPPSSSGQLTAPQQAARPAQRSDNVLAERGLLQLLPDLQNDPASDGHVSLRKVCDEANLYDSPKPDLLDSDSEGDSMNHDNNNLTPPPNLSPEGRHSPGGSTAANFDRLNLETAPARKDVILNRKRSASRELSRGADRASPGVLSSDLVQPAVRSDSRLPSSHRRDAALMKPQAGRGKVKNAQQMRAAKHSPDKSRVRMDSGYASNSRTDTMPSISTDVVHHVVNAPTKPSRLSDIHEPNTERSPGKNGAGHKRPADNRCPNMVLQPESTPITQEQLAAEVKGIYSGLVMVEAKCINIDAQQQALDPNEKLDTVQWQALIALHRTLLYEHHDFLMATQHPTANSDLRGLASKYCMPARMWKHGIHAFLELLRHRRPESQEYMVAFIYLAYQMMALLYETVPGFTDTWIECLGDLARYRMAIEEEKEPHATWGGVAGRWYSMASDRHPAIGRLYHHLGILERPSLRKLYFYGKALTALLPFVNAKESLATLCTPIVQDDQVVQSSSTSAEAFAICFHAKAFSGSPTVRVQNDANKTLELLERQPSSKIANYGVSLVVTNIAGMFEYGSPQTKLRAAFALAINQSIQAARPSASNMQTRSPQDDVTSLPSTTTSASQLMVDFSYSCFATIIRRRPSPAEMQDLLPFVHAKLVWFSALLKLQARLKRNTDVLALCAHHLTRSIQFWQDVAGFLNHLANEYAITNRIEAIARQGTFLEPEQNKHKGLLCEDYLLRGLVWTQFYYPANKFNDMEDDDGSRTKDDPERQQMRGERVLWLGLCIAFAEDSPLEYDSKLKRYRARSTALASPLQQDEHVRENLSQTYDQTMVQSTTSATSSGPTPSGSDGDFEMILTPAKSMVSTPEDTNAQSQQPDTVEAEPKRAPTWAFQSKQQSVGMHSWASVASGRSGDESSKLSSVKVEQRPMRTWKTPAKAKEHRVDARVNDSDGFSESAMELS